MPAGVGLESDSHCGFCSKHLLPGCPAGAPDGNAFRSEITAEKLSQGASSAGHSVTAMSTLTPTPYELTFFGSRDGAQTYL